MSVERNLEQLLSDYDLASIKDLTLKNRLIGISDMIMGRKFPMKTQALKTLISSLMLPTLTHQPGEGYVRMIISEKPIIDVIRGGKRGVPNLHTEGHVFAVYSFLLVRDQMIKERYENGIKKPPSISEIVQEITSRLGEGHPISMKFQLNSDGQNPLNEKEEEDEEQADTQKTSPFSFGELQAHRDLLATYGKKEIENLLNSLTEKIPQGGPLQIEIVSSQKLKQLGIEIEPVVKSGIDFVRNASARIKNNTKEDGDTFNELFDKVRLIEWYFKSADGKVIQIEGRGVQITNLWELIETLNNVAEQEEKKRESLVAASSTEENYAEE